MRIGVRAPIVAKKRGNSRGAKGRRKVDFVTDRQTSDNASIAVPHRAKQVDEGDEGTKIIRSWAESSVWTERMLTTLEQGVKGGKWFSLIDKVYRAENIAKAAKHVLRKKTGAGVDNITKAKYEAHLSEYNAQLANQLKSDTYRPLPIKRSYIAKPGSREKRPLGIPCLRDRIAQQALRQVIEPIFETDFSPHSYGFRPQRSCKDALREAQGWLEQDCQVVVDADLRKFFDTIDHGKMLALIEQKISDGRVLKLISQFLQQEIMEDLKTWQPTEGTPQGAVISPLLANIFLDPLDHLLQHQGFHSVRYADDFVILCQNDEEADSALEVVRAWCAEAALTLHPDKTHIVDMRLKGSWFDFLGYRFKRTLKKGNMIRVPSDKAQGKLRQSLRPLVKRTSGISLEQIIEKINPKLRGWFEYFKHSYIGVMKDIDGWVRMRLRSILRKRRKGKGRGRGADHQRWPNAYFEERGLFVLEIARAQAVQSLWSNH